jgi:hypothetical protein
MPWQLREGLRRHPKGSRTSRPLVELLQHIDINDLCRWKVFPSQYDWHKAHYLEAPFRYPFIKSLVITLQNIEVSHHSDYIQLIPLRWCRTGFGGNSRPRPLFVCNCGRSVSRLYFRHANLACRRCCDATYASRTCSKRLRPILQAKRLQTFLKFKAGTGMSKRNQQRIRARIATAPGQELHSKRLAHHSIQLPQRNYGTYGAMHWR